MSFLTRFLIASALAFHCFPLGILAANGEPEKSNIVFLMADDLGFADLSPEFMPRSYEIMRLHGFSIPFYTMQNCAPSRTALMTGRSPADFGLVGINSPRYFSGIEPSEVILPERLKEAGYDTAIFGKWHLGLNTDQGPLNNGFDEFIGFTHGWINYYGPQANGLNYKDKTGGHDHHGAHDLQFNGIPLHTPTYSTFIFSNAATQFIRKKSTENKPFFLYVPFNAPHTPYSAPRKYVDQYRERFDVSTTELEWLHEYVDNIWGLPLDQEIQAAIPLETLDKLVELMYYATVRALDDAVADIFEALVATDQLANTFFMFTSDNGAGLGRKRGGSNGIFKGGKGTPYEGGHRVANFVVWDGVLPVDHQVNANVWIGDLFETFLAIAGDKRSNTEFESNNRLEQLLTGNTAHRKNGGFHIPIHISKTTYKLQDITVWAIINRSFKYIRTIHHDALTGTELSDEEELYNVTADPSETNNMVSSPGAQKLLLRMRRKFENAGGKEYLESLPKRRGGGWNDFPVPQEWGFPGRRFTDEEILNTSIY